MKKILIGTHNKGKFKEISFLISGKFRKINPISLKLPSPKETGKTFTEFESKFFFTICKLPCNI